MYWERSISTRRVYSTQQRGLLVRLRVDAGAMRAYLMRIERTYRPHVPFHNSLHATDVLHAVHLLLSGEKLGSVFTDLEVFAALFAAVIHDVDHPGLTNQFLVNTSNVLSLCYNDASVLENHHIATAFSLLPRAGADGDPFRHFSAKQRTTFRKLVIDQVLATDMAKHMQLLSELKTMVEARKVSAGRSTQSHAHSASGASAASDPATPGCSREGSPATAAGLGPRGPAAGAGHSKGSREGSTSESTASAPGGASGRAHEEPVGVLMLDNYAERLLLLRNLLHAADLSNPTRPQEHYVRWVDRIMSEFFLQGDTERELGLDVSPMCDRRTASVPKAQVRLQMALFCSVGVELLPRFYLTRTYP